MYKYVWLATGGEARCGFHTLLNQCGFHTLLNQQGFHTLLNQEGSQTLLSHTRLVMRSEPLINR